MLREHKGINYTPSGVVTYNPRPLPLTWIKPSQGRVNARCVPRDGRFQMLREDKDCDDSDAAGLVISMGGYG